MYLLGLRLQPSVNIDPSYVTQKVYHFIFCLEIWHFNILPRFFQVFRSL